MLSTLENALAGQRRTPLVRAVRRSLHAAGAGGGRIVVGCSGGPDSTALVGALYSLADSLELALHVVAVDHQLRPAAATEAAAVCALAERLGLPAETVAITVPPGPSRMALARTARYQALAEAARRYGAAWIAVGHIRDDQSESMLIRWLGGAGLTGLSGMAPVAPLPTGATAKSPIFLLRPLLSQPRTAVESFLAPLRPLLAPLPFFDPSNADPRYLRSRLRREALPLLRQIAPHLDEHLLALSRQLRADAEYLDGAAEQALPGLLVEHGDGTLTLSAAAIASLPAALRARVLRLAARHHFAIDLGQRHVEALLDLCLCPVGRRSLDLPGGLHAERRRGMLHLVRRPAAVLDAGRPVLI